LTRVPTDNSQALALGDTEKLKNLLSDRGDAADTDDWLRAQVAAGIPTIASAGSEAFVPQMVNLDLLGGISFSKGCYVGQEVVARTQNLGRIKRRMFRYALRGAGPVTDGEPLLADDGSKLGTVVNGVAAGDRWELLAVVALGKQDQELHTADGGELERLPLPYEIPALPN